MQALAAPEMEMLAKYAPYAPVQQSNNSELFLIGAYVLLSLTLLSSFLVDIKGNFNSNNSSTIMCWLCVTFIIALLIYNINPMIMMEAPEVILALTCCAISSLCISFGFVFWW